jgi:hypothetical protein
MVEVAYVASSVLMGALVLAIVGAILRLREWNDYSPGEGTGGLASLRGLADSPTVWIAAFLLLTVGFGGAAVLYVSGAFPAGALLPALGAATFLVITGYLFVGAYSSALSRGRPTSQAVFEGTMLIGFLFVLAIAVKLVVG